jgi:uncharacterized protein YbaA (DUF1428 family)
MPPSLIAAARTAADDERRHRRTALGSRQRDGDGRSRRSRRDLAIAIENAVEGCVNGHRAACDYQAAAAADATLATTMRTIAEEEHTRRPARRWLDAHDTETPRAHRNRRGAGRCASVRWPKRGSAQAGAWSASRERAAVPQRNSSPSHADARLWHLLREGCFRCGDAPSQRGPCYVDSYRPRPDQEPADYWKVARSPTKVWRGSALEAFECLADDVKPGKWTSFPGRLEPDETVISHGSSTNRAAIETGQPARMADRG